MITDEKSVSLTQGKQRYLALSSRKIDKYDCRTRQEILSYNSIV